MSGNRVWINKGVFKRVAAAWFYIGKQLEMNLTPGNQKKIANYILNEALQLVPVDTGALKRSGRVVKAANRTDLHVIFGNSSVRYAAVVEYGRMSYRPMAPQPYMRPAVAKAQARFGKVAKIEFVKAKRSWPSKFI